ncbi:hypothetical protein FQZ97_1021940 [compost metagenome]
MGATLSVVTAGSGDISIGFGGCLSVGGQNAAAKELKTHPVSAVRVITDFLDLVELLNVFLFFSVDFMLSLQRRGWFMLDTMMGFARIEVSSRIVFPPGGSLCRAYLTVLSETSRVLTKVRLLAENEVRGQGK